MFKILPFLLLVGIVYCGDDLDSLIDKIFGAGSTNHTQNKEEVTVTTPIVVKKETDKPKPCFLIDGSKGECISYFDCTVRNDVTGKTGCPWFTAVCCSIESDEFLE